MFGAGVCPCFSIPRVINNCGAMAEFERSLIQERVRAGLRNARAKGKQLGRPKVIADVSRIGITSGCGVRLRCIMAQERNEKEEDAFAIPHVFSPDAEALLQRVRQKVDAFCRKQKAARFPRNSEPGLRGDALDLYRALSRHTQVRRGLEFAEKVLKQETRAAKTTHRTPEPIGFFEEQVENWKIKVKNAEDEVRQVELKIASRLRASANQAPEAP